MFKDAEIVDYAAPYGVFSVARRFDPELDAFLIADALRPVRTKPASPCCPITASSTGLTWTPPWRHSKKAIDWYDAAPLGIGVAAAAAPSADIRVVGVRTRWLSDVSSGT